MYLYCAIQVSEASLNDTMTQKGLIDLAAFELVVLNCLCKPMAGIQTPRSITFIESAKAQICRTKAKPQQIVATRLLYCLQHPVLFKSSAKDSPPPIFHFNS